MRLSARRMVVELSSVHWSDFRLKGLPLIMSVMGVKEITFST
jgi:hypothetical protein